MSLSSSVSESPESTLTTETTPRRRRPAYLWTCIVLVLLVAVAVLAWRGLAGRTLDEVAVGISDHDCRGDGTTVRTLGSGALRIETSPNMRCTFTIDVVNAGGRGVHLGEVRAAIMGPETGSVLLAESIDGVAPRGDTDTVDALHTLGLDLPSRGTVSFDIVVVFHPAGCNAGGTLTINGFPSIDVSTLRVQQTLEGKRDLAFHHDIRTRGCRQSDRS